MESIIKIFGNNLRQIRVARGYTQEYVAEKLDTNYQTYQNWDSGKRIPKPETLIAISKILGVEQTDFFRPANGHESLRIIQEEKLKENKSETHMALALGDMAKEKGKLSDRVKELEEQLKSIPDDFLKSVSQVKEDKRAGMWRTLTNGVLGIIRKQEESDSAKKVV